MDIQFISLISRNKISLNKINSIFEEHIISNDNKIIKEYCLIQGKKIEIIYLNSVEEIKRYYNKNVKKAFIIAEEINKEDYKKLNFKDFIIFTGKKKTYYGNEMILNQLVNKELLDLELLSKFVINDDNYVILKQSQKNIILIIGKCKKDKIISEVVLNTLKQINIIKECTYLDLFIYINQELNLTDLINIEDPLKEYINYRKLKIRQSLIFNKEDESYYCMMIN